MWWRHNAIVCQICLGIVGSGRDLAVVVWVDGQIICEDDGYVEKGWQSPSLVSSRYLFCAASSYNYVGLVLISLAVSCSIPVI